VQLAAAARIGSFGDLVARAAAVPVLVKHAKSKGTMDEWNAFIQLHRCVTAFAWGLMEKEKADAALAGLSAIDKEFLKAFLLESQAKFKGSEGGDLRPSFEEAAKKGVTAEGRALAKEVAGWLAE
jgi:hypothetical protein